MTLAEASELRNKFREIQSKHETEIATKTIELTEAKDRQQKIEAAHYALDQQVRELNSQISQKQREHVQLERTLEEANSRLRHLVAFTLSIIPRLSMNAYDGRVLASKPINLSDLTHLTNLPRPETDVTVENALTLKLNREGLLQQYSPTIFAAENNIYLTLGNHPKITYIAGSYNTDQIRSSIDSVYTVLEKIHSDGLPSQLPI